MKTKTQQNNFFSNFWSRIKFTVKTKWQTASFGLFLVASIVAFLYAIGFGTSWSISQEMGNNAVSNYVKDTVNSKNILMFNLSLGLVLSVAFSMLFGSANRTKYYLTNFITLGIVLLLFATVSIIYIITIREVETSMLALLNDPANASLWERVFRINGSSAEGVRLTFKLGYAASALTIVANLAAIGVMVQKYLYLNVRQETYSDVMRKIELGQIEVIQDKKSAIDFDSEEIKIDVAQLTNIEDIKVDKMRYQANKSSYWLALLSVVLLAIAGFMSITYSSFSNDANELRVNPNYQIAIDIALLIIMLLATFLGAEKMKNYQKKWSIGMFVLAAINVARIFFVPTIFHNQYLNYMNNIDTVAPGGLPTSRYIIIVIVMVAAIALQIAGGVINYIKTTKLEKHIRELGEK